VGSGGNDSIDSGSGGGAAGGSPVGSGHGGGGSGGDGGSNSSSSNNSTNANSNHDSASSGGGGGGNVSNNNSLAVPSFGAASDFVRTCGISHDIFIDRNLSLLLLKSSFGYVYSRNLHRFETHVQIATPTRAAATGGGGGSAGAGGASASAATSSSSAPYTAATLPYKDVIAQIEMIAKETVRLDNINIL
jgi:hypothetical protein